MVQRLRLSGQDWGRGQECFLPVAVLAHTSQFKVVVKLVPEFAEF